MSSYLRGALRSLTERRAKYNRPPRPLMVGRPAEAQGIPFQHRAFWERGPLAIFPQAHPGRVMAGRASTVLAADLG